MSEYKFNWEDTQEVAKGVARKVAREYPGIDADDVEQAILLEVVRRENTFKHMNYEIPQLHRYLTNYARKFCNDERISAYQWSDQYHYTTKEVRALCAEALFDRDAFLDKVTGDIDLMMNFEEIMCRVADLQNAYGELREREQNLIYRRYVIGETLSHADTQALSVAIGLLARKINKGRSIRSKPPIDHDGSGARKAISNRHAAYITEEQNHRSLTHRYAAW